MRRLFQRALPCARKACLCALVPMVLALPSGSAAAVEAPSPVDVFERACIETLPRFEGTESRFLALGMTRAEEGLYTFEDSEVLATISRYKDFAACNVLASGFPEKALVDELVEAMKRQLGNAEPSLRREDDGWEPGWNYQYKGHSIFVLFARDPKRGPIISVAVGIGEGQEADK